MDPTFGWGYLALGIVGIIILIGVYSMGRKMGALAKIGALFGVVLIGLAGAGYIVENYDSSANPAEIVPSAAYDVSVSEYEAEVYAYASEHHVVVAMIYNTTSNAFVTSTGVFNLNFTLIRADVLTTDAIARVYLGNVPTVDIAGAADEYILDENGDGTFNALFTKSGAVTSYETANVLVEAGSSNFCNVTFTLNGAAAHEMSLYESVDLPIVVGGETWIISCEMSHIDT
jgi:hypothetical protein